MCTAIATLLLLWITLPHAAGREDLRDRSRRDVKLLRVDGRAEKHIRSLAEDNLATPTMPPTNGSLPGDYSGATKPITINFSLLFPLFSISCAVWFVRRHKRACCNIDTVLDETIPSEIIIRRGKGTKEPETIELEDFVVTRLEQLENKRHMKDLDDISMLNHSDWTDYDEHSEEGSYSWVENHSTIGDFYMMN